MKILMSGMSTRTVGSSRLKLHYLNFNPLLKLALEEFGHKVDQRRLTFGEDLSGYDLAFLHVNPLDKIVCQNVPEVCYALDQLRGKAVIFCEDWVSCEIRNSWHAVLYNRWEKWLKWKGYSELPKEQKDLMGRILPEVLDGDSWPVIANFYGWGQAEQFFKKNFATERTSIVDPSAMAAIPEFNPPAEKYRAWVLAALQKHDNWADKQGFTWPLERFGNMREDQQVLSESEVTQRYADSWGVVAPRYPVIGWFRPRFLLAAATGSVLYCDRAEGVYLGPPYTVPLREIERKSDADLEELAANQAEALHRQVWSKERLFDELNFIIKATLEAV